MSTPTRTQVDTALGRVVELCQPGHLERCYCGNKPTACVCPNAWECNLRLALQRSDQFAGALRSPTGAGPGSSGGEPSDPTLSAAIAAMAPRRKPLPGEEDPGKPVPYDIDFRLRETARAVVADCWWLLTGTTPGHPSCTPATVHLMCRSVLDRVGTIPAPTLASVVRHAQELTGLILDVCHTDLTKTGRRSTAVDCLVCSRPVACTTRDPIRGGWCSACNMAYRRARDTTPGLDRVLFGRRRRAQLTAPAPVVHVDPTDTIPAPL